MPADAAVAEAAMDAHVRSVRKVPAAIIARWGTASRDPRAVAMAELAEEARRATEEARR